ncbi:MAG: CPBP family intramembrane glutamic endopeptidase [Bacteriovorax sp.]
MKFAPLFIALNLLFLESAYANFHTVGWVNTFVPGGGRLMMGEYLEAGKEAALEVGTFGLGYSMSPDSSFTLDGTPIDYPTVGTYTFTSKRRQSYCSKYDPIRKRCLQYRNQTITTVNSAVDYNEKDTTKPLTAAFLQEFGLKYHIMNAFFSYRDQYNLEGGDPGQGIDQRSAKEMFKDPFRWEVLSSPWVYVPIALTSAFVYFDYRSQLNQTSQEITPLNGRSKAYLAFDQMIMYPIGSAAPEEAFYRGFVQNEFYYMVRSPYFSVPMSSLVFALSHSQDGWPSAFISGLYQGMLAYKNDGNLAYGNAVHFWGVVALGVETYVLTLLSQAKAPPVALKFNFTY